MKALIILSSTLFLAGCFDGGGDGDAQVDKSATQAKTIDSVKLGEVTFEKNCLSCHGKAGQGVENWEQKQANGKYPAPALNGIAHAWHHSPEVLLNTINNGGAKLGGWMPALKDQLSEKEKHATIDYIYSLWPEELQKKYDLRFKPKN